MKGSILANKVDLSVVLPAYLEEENLRLLLPRVKAVLDSMPIHSEILVIDTPTPLDHTQEVCRENAVRYLPRGPSDNFGDAVRSGICAATGKRIVFMDADGSHSPEMIPELYQNSDVFEVVIASRYIEGGYTENSRSLVWMSNFLNVTYRIVLGLKCKDVSNSFKLYRMDLLKELKLTSNNFDIIQEILFKITRNHPEVRIKEVPFSFKRRMFGDTKRNLFLFCFAYLFTIVRLRLSVVPFRRQRQAEIQSSKSSTG